MTLLHFLYLASSIFIAVDSNCVWIISEYGVLDLSPLAKEKLYVERNNDQNYQLEFTPCGNNIICDMNTVSATAMATQMGPSDKTNCNGVISRWDTYTTPRVETNSNGEYQVVFDYPVVENLSGAGCVDGRQGEFIFICDMSAVPYSNTDFYQDSGSNPCTYHTTLRTKYACANVNTNGDSSNGGLSAGWITIIIFVSVLFGYCLIGYLIAGYKTKQWTNFRENMPQYNTFWTYFPRLVLTGCSVSYQYVRSLISKSNGIDTSELVEDD